jgi:hypothetical protein
VKLLKMNLIMNLMCSFLLILGLTEQIMACKPHILDPTFKILLSCLS